MLKISFNIYKPFHGVVGLGVMTDVVVLGVVVVVVVVVLVVVVERPAKVMFINYCQ